MLVVTLVAAACGPVVTTTSTDSPTSSTTTIAPPTIAPPQSTQPTTPITTTTLPATTTTLPTTLVIGDWEGDIIEFGPVNGAGLAVIGVRYNDVLNVREGPGIDHPVITTLQPTADNVVALGLTWSRPGSAWYAIDIEGTQGWASASFLSQRGGTFDFTSMVVEALGEIPTSGSLIRLGAVVAEALASDDPPSSIEQPGPQVVGEIGEVVYDVLGLGDDSVHGYRLRIFATNEDGTWTLRTVEATLFCSRAVSDDLCV